ncbi:unnamed protein product [Polarella glacialis]|uniref:N-acetyltransferase domain-containing protein n=1 Tax=Polarella glacialis TaxID=89957 RepID=A0A813DXV3_POLGL|nr:unnamed protein product [Polarella glacialis]CAE8604610.1 unnamed protein product [Polarella glacialis]
MAEQTLRLVCTSVLPGDEPGLRGIRRLFTDYNEYLLTVGCDVALFQGFELELAALPGKYSPEANGMLVLCSVADAATCSSDSSAPILATLELDASNLSGSAALTAGEPVACIALRSLEEAGVGELKRMFISAAGRRQGLGESLSKLIMSGARARGYSKLRLDTLERLPAAVALYEHKLGFRRIGAYCHNPLPDALYFEINL